MYFKKLSRQNKEDKGFTLIELLVVISIISLLSSIVLASLQQARKKSQETVMVQHANQVRDAIFAYKLENGEDTPGLSSHYSNAAWNDVVDTLVSDGFLNSEPNFDNLELRAPSGGAWIRTQSTNWINGDGSSDFYCEGGDKDVDPAYFIFFLTHPDKASDIYNGVFPRMLVKGSLTSHVARYYCLFLPIQ